MTGQSEEPLDFDIEINMNYFHLPERPIKLGYWLSAKKKKKLKFHEFEQLCK